MDKVKKDYVKFEVEYCVEVRNSWHRDLMAAVGTLPEPLRNMCRLQVEGLDFQECPGGISRHHAYVGGLMKHTLEVVLLSSTLARGLAKQTHDNVVCAAVFHDLGKKTEYGWDNEGCWQTIQGKMLRHIPESYHCFRNWASQCFMPWDRQVEIGHMILAHHGRPEWRTPAEPYTLGAQILHLADMASCHAMTDEERDAQRISFAYGNVKLHNPELALETVKRPTTSYGNDYWGKVDRPDDRVLPEFSPHATRIVTVQCGDPECGKCNGARHFDPPAGKTVCGKDLENPWDGK